MAVVAEGSQVGAPAASQGSSTQQCIDGDSNYCYPAFAIIYGLTSSHQLEVLKVGQDPFIGHCLT